MNNRRVFLIILITLAIFSSAYIIRLLESPQNMQFENLTSETPSSIEFFPLSLCKVTGGDWRNVSALEYPLNESEGVYNPTTDTSISYKCFCPSGKRWNTDTGCE